MLNGCPYERLEVHSITETGERNEVIVVKVKIKLQTKN